MENTSNSAQFLTTELRAILSTAQLTIGSCRYDESFVDCWTMPSVDPRSHGNAELQIMDGRSVAEGGHNDEISAISWLVSYVLSGNGDHGPRYLLTDAELPPSLCGLSDLLERAIAPQSVVGLNEAPGISRVDVETIAAKIMQPTPRNDKARARLKSVLINDFLAPGRRHMVSNIVSPMLLGETLRCAYPDLPRGADDRVVTSLCGQLRSLGLLDITPISREEACTVLFPAVESAKRRIMAASADPISIRLIDDNPAFLPILNSVLRKGCVYNQSLPEQDSTFRHGSDVVLFLDLRLLPTDQGSVITNSSGFVYASALARKYPGMPIVLFSSTQQRRLQDAVLDVREKEGLYNLITRFSKPSLSAHGGLNASACMQSLIDLAGAGVEAAMMIEQSRAMRAMIGDGVNPASHPFYDALYRQRWLEVLLSPAGALPGKSPTASACQDIDLIRDFAVRWATHPQMDEAMQWDVTDKRAGWVWALAVIRIWLASGDPEGLLSFARRLQAGLLPDYEDTAMVEGIPDSHSGANRDSVHDVLLWASGPQLVTLSVAIKTIIHHICRGPV